MSKCGLALSAPSMPEPERWAQYYARAWTAAWLTVRGRGWLGPREVLAEPGLKGEVRWMTRNGPRHCGHRPDLAVVIPSRMIAIEIERQRGPDKQLRALLSMYERWAASKGTVDVIYICRGGRSAERIADLAYQEGLSQPRVELISTLRAQAEQKATRQLTLPGFTWPDAVTA